MILKTELPLLPPAGFSQKYASFDYITWNLNCPYYHELKFLQKCPRFNEVIWIFKLPPLLWGVIFSNIKQFWWRLLKIWPSPIIMKWNFRLNRTVFMSLEKFTCPFYHHIATTMKFSTKYKTIIRDSLQNLTCP